MPYELTQTVVTRMNRMSAGCAIGSVVLCSVILIMSFIVHRCVAARSSLDRISFRLLLWTMVIEIFYDITFTVSVLIPKTSGIFCGASVAGVMMSIGVTNYLLMCVALNLCLVLVFGVRVSRLEKYYVIGSFFLGIVIPLVPTIKGSFGWDPLLSICWITASSKHDRIIALLFSLYVWQILSCVLTLLFVVLTVLTLIHQRRLTTQNTARVSLGTNSTTTPHTLGTVCRSQRRRSRRNTVHDRFISIVLRISAYPFALIVVNAFIAYADLHLSADAGVHNKSTFIVYVIYYFIYGARGGIYAAIALFVDPSLRRGLGIVRRSWSSPTDAIDSCVVEPRAVEFTPITDITTSTEPPRYVDNDANDALYRSHELCTSPGGFLEAPSAALRSYSDQACLDQELAYLDLPPLYLESQPLEVVRNDTEGMADIQAKDELDNTAESDTYDTFRSL